MLAKSGEDELRAIANEIIPAFSEEALALQYAEEHAPRLRYVSEWGKWMLWDGSCWKQDNTLHALDLARQLCHAAAAHANDDAERLANRATSANVLSLARADRKLAASPINGTPIRGSSIRRTARSICAPGISASARQQITLLR